MASESVGVFGASMGVSVARRRFRFELLHRRVDGELDPRRADRLNCGESERILHTDQERPDRDDAATRGWKAVRGAGAGLAPQRSHMKSSALGARYRVREREQRRTGASEVRDAKLDLG